MALKYPNKRKRKGFWSVYEQARINDFRKVFDEICELIPQIPEPKRGRGRKPNLTLWELYCLFTFFTAFPSTFRE
jgi:hypothetical protein